MRIRSYPSIYALGHAAIAELTKGPVLVEEKIDGSQFSMGVLGGELCVRSKGAVMVTDAPEPMFNRAVETARRLAPDMHPDWVYRCEYLAKPKHNALVYDRIPMSHLIIFDVNVGLEQYLDSSAKATEAARLGLECVPVLYRGMIEDLTHFRSFLETTSVLGGQKIEGVVIKPENYGLFGSDKKVLMGKFVSESFKETHSREWVKSNPQAKDIVATLVETLTTQARWTKAVQHLRERGELEDSPRDIGKLMTEVPQDIAKEESELIKDALFKWAWPQIRRGTVRGLPEWYKEELLKLQFEAA